VTLVDAAGIGVTLVTEKLRCAAGIGFTVVPEKLRCAAGIGFTVVPEKLRFVPVPRMALGLIGILCNTPGIKFMPAILAYLGDIMHSLSCGGGGGSYILVYYHHASI
jgi:hypothetical protein